VFGLHIDGGTQFFPAAPRLFYIAPRSFLPCVRTFLRRLAAG
jgi:hypothetical protein